MGKNVIHISMKVFQLKVCKNGCIAAYLIASKQQKIDWEARKDLYGHPFVTGILSEATNQNEQEKT